MVDPCTASAVIILGAGAWAVKEVAKHSAGKVLRKSATDPNKGKKRAKYFKNGWDCVELVRGSPAAALSLAHRNKTSSAVVGIGEESMKGFCNMLLEQ
ncbi:hypothetical protein FGB62_365g04 [Gracilaria domingensis]|nr:hypothetical protein FGB62_365g04 [Gracilaria domingensis]